MKAEREKVILITGGAGGLGSVMAAVLASEGHCVYLLDLPQVKERADILLQKLTEEGGRGTFIPMDVTSETDWETAVRTVVSEAGRIDVLVNNAGINIRKVIEEMSFDEWMQMMAVNTGSVFLGTKYVIPVMKEQKEGLIINMSSVCGLVGHMYTPEAYTATKSAVTMFTRAVAAERLGEVPLGRLCKAEDVANAVQFLVSDQSSFINGLSLAVDGGTTCY